MVPCLPMAAVLLLHLLLRAVRRLSFALPFIHHINGSNASGVVSDFKGCRSHGF